MLIPSVTETLCPWSDFSHIPAKVLDAAATRGTAAHDACANIARGLMVINVPEEIEGYVTSFRRWFDFMVDEVLLVEERLVNTDFYYHGEPDLLIKARHGEIILVDNKTPVQLQVSWKLQLAAYRHLIITNKSITPDRVGSLRLSPEGKTAKMDYYENSLQDFNYFLQALNLYRLFNT